MKKTVLYLVLLLGVGLLAAPPSAPVNVSYVYSDSMEPTIHTNDGYILVPATDVQSGDIVTFQMSGRDEYTTHRVVGVSEQGYITRGDNNPTTDQAAGYSYVQQEDIVGKVLTHNGEPVIIPNLGDLLSVLQQYRLAIVLGLAGMAAALFARNSSQSSQYTREIPRVRSLLLPILLIATISMIAFPIIGASTVSQTFVVTQGNADAPGLLAPGESETHTMTFNRSRSPLTHTALSVNGATMQQQTRNASKIAVTMQVTAPDEIGPKSVGVTVYAYPALLPRETVVALHRIHPVLASVGTALVLFVPLLLVTLLTIDGQTPLRDRHRSRPSPGGEK